MTHYRLKGNLDQLRQYGQSAISTKNALRIVNSSFNLPIADMYRIKPDGTIIHARRVFDQELVTVELAPMVLEPQPVEQRNIITPPVEWFIESFYVVYDVIVPALVSNPHYTGEHLLGYYTPPYLDLEFETRIKGSPGFRQYTGFVRTPTDENLPLTPTQEKDFQHEAEPIRNYDLITLDTYFFRTFIYIGLMSEYGWWIVFAKSMRTESTRTLKINGNVFKSESYVVRNATGVQSWGYDAHEHVVGTTQLPRMGVGTYVDWQTGTLHPPQDDRTGDESDGAWEIFHGGACDPETNDYIVMWREREVTPLVFNPESIYIGLGTFNGPTLEVLVEKEYEESYSLYIYIPFTF